MNCPHCGNPTSAADKFCRACGRSVETQMAHIQAPGQPQATAYPISPTIYRSAGATAGWVTGLLIASAVIALVGILTTWNVLRLVNDIGGGELVSNQQVENADSAMAGSGILQLLFLIGTAVAWCIWQHRAHSNLLSLGSQGLRFTPGWAVGYWFIPFINLVRPYEAMRELWQASDPGATLGWRSGQVTPVIGWWWGAFVLSGLVGRVGARFPDDSLDQISVGLYFLISSDALFISAAILAIFLLRGINRRQEGRGRIGPAPSSGSILPS